MRHSNERLVTLEFWDLIVILACSKPFKDFEDLRVHRDAVLSPSFFQIGFQLTRYKDRLVRGYRGAPRRLWYIRFILSDNTSKLMKRVASMTTKKCPTFVGSSQ